MRSIDCDDSIAAATDTQHEKTPLKRSSKGTHVLPIIHHLMESKDRMFIISSTDDYHYPGFFHHDYPQRMGFCPDITALPTFEPSDPDFLFTDIQLGKGKARSWRAVDMYISGMQEEVMYRIVPCNGVKVCPAQDCEHIVPTSEVRPCPNHKVPLKRTMGCPVEFVYIKPSDSSDNRRWITGIDRSSDMKNNFLHNHPLHADAKIPAKVKADITRALVKNPHLTTRDITTGEYAFTYSYITSLRGGQIRAYTHNH